MPIIRTQQNGMSPELLNAASVDDSVAGTGRYPSGPFCGVLRDSAFAACSKAINIADRMIAAANICR